MGLRYCTRCGTEFVGKFHRCSEAVGGAACSIEHGPQAPVAGGGQWTWGNPYVRQLAFGIALLFGIVLLGVHIFRYYAELDRQAQIKAVKLYLSRKAPFLSVDDLSISAADSGKENSRHAIGSVSVTLPKLSEITTAGQVKAIVDAFGLSCASPNTERPLLAHFTATVTRKDEASRWTATSFRFWSEQGGCFDGLNERLSSSDMS